MSASLHWLIVLLVALGNVPGVPDFAYAGHPPRAVFSLDRVGSSPIWLGGEPVALALPTLLPSPDRAGDAPPYTESLTTDLVGVARMWSPLRGISLLSPQWRVQAEYSSAALRPGLSPFSLPVLAGWLLALAPLLTFFAIGLRWARPLRAPPGSGSRRFPHLSRRVSPLAIAAA